MDGWMDEFLVEITTCIKMTFTSFIITLEEVFICQSEAVCLKNISKLQKHHGQHSRAENLKVMFAVAIAVCGTDSRSIFASTANMFHLSLALI